MLIVRHLGTPNSDFNGCHCMRDPVLYRSMVLGQIVSDLYKTMERMGTTLGNRCG